MQMVALGPTICIKAQVWLWIGQGQRWEVSHHSDRPPVQKGYGANLEYVGEIGGQLCDRRGKMEVPA